MSEYVVGVDLGGSKVRVALDELGGRAVARFAAATAQGDADGVVAQVAQLARELAESVDVPWARIAAAAVGLPGVVQRDGRGLRLAPNLPRLADVDLAAALGERLGVPVALDNDVNMATLAEQRNGRGVGVSDFVFIAVGTGIGMGIVASGRLQRGASGAAGEIGFLPLGTDPYAPANQLRGPLEQAVGGVAVARRYTELSGSTAPGALEVFARHAAGDLHARTALDEQARATALAVVSALSVLDPALVVFGGGIGSREDFVVRVRDHVARLTSRQPAIEVSGLGETGGLLGALELAREHAELFTAGHGGSGGISGGVEP